MEAVRADLAVRRFGVAEPCLGTQLAGSAFWVDPVTIPKYDIDYIETAMLSGSRAWGVGSGSARYALAARTRGEDSSMAAPGQGTTGSLQI
jgi:hypothetical protein